MTSKHEYGYGLFKIACLMIAVSMATYLSVWVWKKGEGEEIFPHLTHSRPRRDIHHPNLAMSMIADFAVRMNYSDCWICQHMPHSTTAPMSLPIPLTKEEWYQYNWQNLGQDNDCYSHPQHTKHTAQLNNPGTYINPYLTKKVLATVSAAVNKEHLPVDWNTTDIFRVVTYEKMDWRLEGRDMVFKIDTTHAQTNCSAGTKSTNCTMTGDASPKLKCYSEVLYHAEETKFLVGFLQCVTHVCHPQVKNNLIFRTSSVHHTLNVMPLFNVSFCFTGYQDRNKLNVPVGESSCENITLMQTNLTHPSDLPEQIYAVCGDKAYTHLPANSHGRCYLAHVVPMMRKVNNMDIEAFYSQHVSKTKRQKRTLPWWKQLLGTIIPSYGVYNTQSELQTLSTVLESHMNASNAAVHAMATEVKEIKTIALQNRMALDVMLASQGGACAVIGTECCSYVSDPTMALDKLTEDTQRGLTELHKNQGETFADFVGGLFGGIKSTLMRTLISIAVVIIVIFLIFTCISVCIRTVMSKIVSTTSSVIQPLSPKTDWVPPFHGFDIV